MKRCTCGCGAFTAIYTESIVGYYSDTGIGLDCVEDGDVVDHHGRKTPYTCQNCGKKYKAEEDIPDHQPAIDYAI